RRSCRLLSNPLLKGCNLLGLERLTLRGHPLGLLLGSDSLQEQAGSRIAGNDRGSRVPPFDCQSRRVEPQATLLLQGSVARETSFRENGLDLLLIVDAVVRENRQ